jgi:V8-like Glu-specific endopeptidase
MRFVPGLRWLARPSARIAGMSMLAIVAIVFASPADGDTSSLAAQLASPVQLAPAATQEGASFAGTPTTGALFTVSNGTLDYHFCTASVVHSPRGNLLITAAHCVTGRSGPIAFAPGYHDGKTPYGIWYVSRVFVDQAWSASGSIADDVAFLQLKVNAAGTEIEDVTGANQLGLSEPAGQLTQVIGYPDGSSEPVVCENQTKAFGAGSTGAGSTGAASTGATQLEFDCGGYPDGTSGSPFLVQVSQATGEGTVTGVIGGYEQGGDSPSVSYSIAFGSNVGALYQTAAAAS